METWARAAVRVDARRKKHPAATVCGTDKLARIDTDDMERRQHALGVLRRGQVDLVLVQTGGVVRGVPGAGYLEVTADREEMQPATAGQVVPNLAVLNADVELDAGARVFGLRGTVNGFLHVLKPRRPLVIRVSEVDRGGGERAGGPHLEVIVEMCAVVGVPPSGEPAC